MRKLFRPRNLLLFIGLGVIIGVVLSKKNSAPAPAYPDPWASPAPAASTDGEATEATSTSNGAGSTPETADA